MRFPASRRQLFSPRPALAALLLVCSPLRAVEIVAHRGASHDAPENTLAAQKLAWEQNADAVETDIHLTKDGRIIVSHDANTKRTTGTERVIAESTQAELRLLDAGRWGKFQEGGKFAGEKLPTLEEQLALIPAGKRLFVEIKSGPEIVPELARVLQAAGRDEKTITIISFNYASLQEVRKRLPAFPTQYLVSYRAPDPTRPPPKKKQPTLDEVIAEAKAAKLTGLDLQHTWPLTSADAQKIKDAGLELHVWTVDEVDIARRWIGLGVKSITTNRPGWLREQLQR